MDDFENPKVRWLRRERSNQFPKFKSHDEASCFHCGGDFGPDGYWFSSGHAPGRGAFVQDCRKCGYATWYDLEEGDDAHVSQER